MAHKPKPHVHGRDHEHGGADTTLIHYQAGGDFSGGGGAGGIGGGTPTSLIVADEGAALPTQLSSGFVVADEATPLTVRPSLNFVGAGVTATDNPANNRIDVTIPGAAAAGGGSALQLQAASAWNKVISNDADRAIHWELSEMPADFDDFWYLADANDNIITPGTGVEFVYLGMKKWGAIHCSGWISRPSLSSDYQAIITAPINGGLTFATNETYDRRIKNQGFSGVGTPFRSWVPPNEFNVTFHQNSGSSMTLNSSGSYAYCFVVFQEVSRT